MWRPTTRSPMRTPSRRLQSSRATDRTRGRLRSTGAVHASVVTRESSMTITDDSTAVLPASRPEPAARPHSPDGGLLPHLAEGMDLIGEYEGSGFKEPPSLVRRADG